MKKLVVVLATILVAGSLSAKSSENSQNTWNGKINVSKLGEYLDLSFTQSEEVLNISQYFSKEIRKANASNENKKEQAMKKAVYGNLKLMRETLDQKQYSKYATLLNVTLRNKGIVIE